MDVRAFGLWTVRTEMLVFPGFRVFDWSFCPRMSATSAGYPAPKLTLWAALSFLSLGWKSRGDNGALLNSTWNYNSHETTTFECPSSTHWGPKVATTVKRRLLHPDIVEREMLHSQRPPNYNNCESTAVKWRLLQNRATTAKRNDREMTS